MELGGGFRRVGRSERGWERRHVGWFGGDGRKRYERRLRRFGWNGGKLLRSGWHERWRGDRRRWRSRVETEACRRSWPPSETYSNPVLWEDLADIDVIRVWRHLLLHRVEHAITRRARRSCARSTS